MTPSKLAQVWTSEHNAINGQEIEYTYEIWTLPPPLATHPLSVYVSSFGADGSASLLAVYSAPLYRQGAVEINPAKDADGSVPPVLHAEVLEAIAAIRTAHSIGVQFHPQPS